VDDKKPVAELTVEQVEEMIKTISSQVNDMQGREDSRAFREKHFSKQARIAELERTTEMLQQMVNILMVEKLTGLRDSLRKGKATKEALEFLEPWLRLTSLKKGIG
jgi:hypothetical protein